MILKNLSDGSDHIEGIDASRERPPSPTSANPISPYLCNRGKRQDASLDPCGCGLVRRSTAQVRSCRRMSDHKQSPLTCAPWLRSR